MDNMEFYVLQIVLNKKPSREFMKALEMFIENWFESNKEPDEDIEITSDVLLEPEDKTEVPQEVIKEPLDIKSRVYIKYDKNYDFPYLIEALAVLLKTPPHKIEEKYIKPLIEDKKDVLIYEGPLELCLELDKILENSDIKTELRFADNG